MPYHEPCNPQEVFVGNHRIQSDPPVLPTYLQGFTTLRFGHVAYTLYGAPLDTTYMRPLFIAREELNAYDRVMTERTLRGK